ncbi:hypothetical protein [Brevibacillus brevis]|uniref:hypothetical protein n=1 Tax=Brevibacillus brevis TaxID=1393 RepID=UPI000D0E53F7|nr:hypothetical protein [Brevibacillus brevis]PSJ62706.1 hypothetical protein C7J99_31620 [Brevibacillus brevis]RED19781.1 hypothetical protein DES34_1391 [Brevibacillus brevis]VEF90359.1 Uncharacterised protein [Brevibacillus brevis]VEF92595.1 Uncharacterised protein [Brevibacillus brevis]GEC93869.1 hypothetical protein BBR01nite_62000 [Brevibacillus brevis]
MSDGDQLKDLINKLPFQKLDVKPPKFEINIDPLRHFNQGEMLKPIQEAAREIQLQHDRKMALLEQMVEKPKPVQQINTLIQNSGTIQNLQNNYDSSTGIQNVTNNSGLTPEEYTKLFQGMRELVSLLNVEKAKDAEEIIDQLDDELSKDEPRRGIVKASASYLTSLFKEVIADPLKSVAKGQFTDYAKVKAPEVLNGLDELVSNML